MWLIDLRSVHAPLESLLASSPNKPSLGPLVSYRSLTELTRNPAHDRSAIEKNWMLFFPGADSFIQYEISPKGGRSLAKLVGNGVTTQNLTDPSEQSCFRDNDDSLVREKQLGGGWHQATNSLRLVLCRRTDKICFPTADNSVFFAIIHRKRINSFRLPLRYERYIMVWSAAPPYGMLGISQYPLLFANETANGYSARENWVDDPIAGAEDRPLFAKFTYTGSITWAWRRGEESSQLNTGYLDDEILLGIGIDDVGRGFTMVKAQDMIQCLRACPGRTPRSD